MSVFSRLASISSLPRLLAAAVVVLFLVVQAPVLLAPPWRPVSVALSQTGATSSGGAVYVSGTITAYAGIASTNVRLVVTALTWPSHPSAVYAYVDPSYPQIGDMAATTGFLDHLGSDLRARGWDSPIRVLDAAKLASFLRANTSGILVVPTTALPENVFSWSTDLLTPWIRGGGTLVWVGELIGGYTVAPGVTPVTWNASLNLQWAGEQRIFGSELVNGAFSPGSVGTTPSAPTTSLGLLYPLETTGAQTDLLGRMGGLSVGWVGSGITDLQRPIVTTKTSIAAVHVGSGTVLLFGDTIGAPALSPVGLEGVSHDVAQILASGIAYTDYSLRDFVAASYPLRADATRTISWAFTLPLPAGSVSVFAFIDPCAGTDLAQCFTGPASFSQETVAVA